MSATATTTYRKEPTKPRAEGDGVKTEPKTNTPGGGVAAPPSPAAPPQSDAGDTFEKGGKPGATEAAKYTWGPTYQSVEAGKSAFHQGQRGPGVENLQKNLKAAGYDVDDDAKFGPKTKAAVEQFRKDNGLPPSGFVDSAFTKKLEPKAIVGFVKSSPELSKLSPDHRAALTAAVAKSPSTDTAGDALRLAGSEGFRSLNDGVKTNVISKLDAHAADPAARGTIVDLATSPGFGRLSDEDKNRLTDYVGGKNAISDAARGDIAKLLASDEYKKAPPAEQSTKLKQFLVDQRSVPGTATAPDGAFDAKRSPYTISAATELPGGGQRYEIDIKGQKIPVEYRRPNDPNLSGAPSVEEVAKSLAALPDGSRALVTKVSYETEPRPGGYMGTSSSGVVSVYPVANKANQAFVDSAMLHETGHTLSGRRWGDDTNDPRWQGWKDAIAKDQVIPSQYARTGAPISDDFAESVLLYQRVKGTPEEFEYRRLMPERFKILDQVTP